MLFCSEKRIILNIKVIKCCAEKRGQAQERKGLALFRDFLKKNGWRYIPGIAFLLLNSYVASWTPRFLGNAVDGLNAKVIDPQYVIQQVVYLVLASVFVFATLYTWRMFIIGNARHLEIFIRERLFRKFQRMPTSFFDRNQTGDLMALAVNDISAVRMTAGMVVAQTLKGAATAFFSLYNMFREIHTPLALFALIPVPFAIVGVVLIGKRVRQQFGRVQKMYARISGMIQENIMGMRVLKAFHREQSAINAVAEKSAEMRDANIKLNNTSSLLNPTIQLCFGLSFLISITYGSTLVVNNTISVGELVAFNDYLLMIMMPVVTLGRVINMAERGKASYRRLNEVLKQPEIDPGEYEEIAEPLHGAISVRNLTFRYPESERDVLRDVSFELPVGKVLGVVGETGCGKTTLIDLLLKLRQAPPNTVFVDNRPLEELPAKAVRAIIGYVPQEEFLFNTTVRDNIRFYEPRATEEVIAEASRAADLAKDMSRLANGYETEVGERGRHLSGGQKKRVTIARALVRDPQVLIFDDVLSSVDVHTEQEILANLRQIMKGKTCMIVSQRISALQHADEILYMEDGRIAERGSHAQLMEQGGKYAAMYLQQSRAAEESKHVSLA